MHPAINEKNPLRAMGIDRAKVERRLRYVGLTDDDVNVISTLQSTLEPHVDALTDHFFEFLARFDEGKALLQNKEAYANARRLKRDHILAMTRGPYDEAYIGQRIALARVYVANHLLQTVTAAKLMGATVIVSGVSSEVATTLVAFGVDVSRFQTVGDLQGGIEEAERLLGLSLVESEPVSQLAHS